MNLIWILLDEKSSTEGDFLHMCRHFGFFIWASDLFVIMQISSLERWGDLLVAGGRPGGSCHHAAEMTGTAVPLLGYLEVAFRRHLVQYANQHPSE